MPSLAQVSPPPFLQAGSGYVRSAWKPKPVAIGGIRGSGGGGGGYAEMIGKLLGGSGGSRGASAMQQGGGVVSFEP